MIKLFYCNLCKTYDENFNDKNVEHTFTNCRDGYGRMIEHIKCPKCGNVLSGFVKLYEKSECDEDGKRYYKEVIKKYQLNLDEGGFLYNKKELIDRIKNPKSIKICKHDYEYITTDKYNFNEYRCKKCGGQMWRNSLYDNR